MLCPVGVHMQANRHVSTCKVKPNDGRGNASAMGDSVGAGCFLRLHGARRSGEAYVLGGDGAFVVFHRRLCCCWNNAHYFIIMSGFHMIGMILFEWIP